MSAWQRLQFLMAALLIAIGAQAKPVNKTFVILHGSGKLILPTEAPMKDCEASLRWSDGCGNGDRICAQGKSEKNHWYLLGGTLAPQERKSHLECESGAKLDVASETCVYRAEGVSTWSRRVGPVMISLSVDSNQLEASKMIPWLSSIRWEER